MVKAISFTLCRVIYTVVSEEQISLFKECVLPCPQRMLTQQSGGQEMCPAAVAVKFRSGLSSKSHNSEEMEY